MRLHSSCNSLITNFPAMKGRLTWFVQLLLRVMYNILFFFLQPGTMIEWGNYW